MEETHHRDGDKALLLYNVSKVEDDDGNTRFVLTEVYETEAGVADHVAQADESWRDIDAFRKWVGECTTTSVLQAPVVHSLW